MARIPTKGTLTGLPATTHAAAELEGLKRKLTNTLSPLNPLLQTSWDVGECAATYWRPQHDTLFYPYTPAHITKPKECKKLFVVPLPDKAMFAVRMVLYTMLRDIPQVRMCNGGLCSAHAHICTHPAGSCTQQKCT